MKVKNKFSKLISEFTILWLEWMKNYNITIDESKTFKERRIAGEACEKLIKKRYQIIEQLNLHFT